MKSRITATLLVVVACVALAACGSSGSSSSSSSTSGSSSSGGKLNVFAAASLTDAFTQIGKQFEAANPGTTVVFNFAGSNTLVQQIAQGAPADAFASADTTNMQKLVDQKAVNTPTTFAKNTLTVIVPAKNPANITTLKDLANTGVKISTADPAVPIGAYTQQVLTKMSKSDQYGPDYKKAVNANVVSKETSVTGVVQKVELGEVDAGYVYVSDAFSEGNKVKSIAIPDQFNVIGDYPIATVKDSSKQSQADAFIKYVLSPPAQKVLEQFKFLPAK